MEKESEYILCAAIWYQDKIKRKLQPRNVESGIVVGGWRHGNCIIMLKTMFYDNWQNNEDENQKRIHVLNNQLQGFITNEGNFIDRKDGLKMALKMNQHLTPDKVYGTDLYSEDLY